MNDGPFPIAQALLCLFATSLFASTVSAAPDYRPVGPETGVRGQATGFFHVERIGGSDWFVDPAGRGVWIAGCEHVRSKGWGSAALGYAPYGRFVETNYPSISAWAEETTGRLAAWGFTAATGEVEEELRHRSLAHAPCLFLSDPIGHADRDRWITPNRNAPGSQFPNVFHPDFPRYCDEFARRHVAPHRDDPWLLGWFIDNELNWSGGSDDPACGLFDRAMELPPEHTARKAAESLLAERAGGSQADSPSFVSRETKRRFLLLCAETYFRETTAAIRRHDPNHLVLGCRFAGPAKGVGDDDVWEIAGQYCDVVSVNWYPWADLARGVVLERRGGAPVARRLREIRERCGKPLYVSEWSFPALDTGKPCLFGAGQRFPTQEGRVAASERFARTLLAAPGVVGFSYFMWYDQPGSGGSNAAFPEDCNYGLVTEHGRLYEALTAMFARVLGDAGRLRGDTVGFRRDADGAYALSNRLVRLSGRIGARDMVSEIAYGDAQPVGRWGGALLEWETPDGVVHYTDVSRLVSVSPQAHDGVLLRAEGSALGARFAVTHRLSLAPSSSDIRVELVAIENLGGEPLSVRDVMMRPFALGDAPPGRLAFVPNRADGLREAGWRLADGSRWVLSTSDETASSRFSFWLGGDGVQHPDARFSALDGPFAIPPGGVWTPPVPMTARLELRQGKPGESRP